MRLPDERMISGVPGTIGTVDVVIPCHNDGAFLLEALESLGPERAKGDGVIIVNDGSSDPATLDVLAGMRMRGFRVIDQEFSVDNGLLTASFKVKRKAVGERYKDLIDSMYTKEKGPAAD